MMIFVYGTLMEGFGNHNLYLKGKIQSINYGETQGELYHLPPGYPAMLDGNGAVKGEIIRVMDDNKLMEKLDSLEGYRGEGNHNLYDRRMRNIKDTDGNIIPCLVYIYQDAEYVKENGILIPDGNWRNFIKNRRSKNE